MYDANNTPARTRSSHYLRTGQLLPPEIFTSQKKNQLNAYEDDCLSHKKWNTYNFVDHYFNGNGRSINLANVGLFRDFLDASSVRNAIKEFQDRQILLAQQKSKNVCRDLARTGIIKTQANFTDKSNTTTDVTLNIFRLFSVGRSTFFRSANCTLDIDCVKRTIHLRGMLKYSIDDAFIDAADLRSSNLGNQEYEGGVPYKIMLNWRKSFSWRGKF